MASFHGDVVQPFPVRRLNDDDEERAVGLLENGLPDPNAALSRFRAFIRSYTNSAGEYVYRAQLAANYEQGTYLLRVELEDLRNVDSALYNVLMEQPVNYLPLFEQAARQVIASAPATRRDIATVQPIQVILNGLAAETLIRHLAASQVSRVVALRGIVIGAARPRIKATRVVLRCRGCHTVRFMDGPVGFGTIQRPKRCDQGQEAGAGGQAQRCPVDPFEELTDLCEFVDTQSLRLQEAPEVVPTSEMPRHIQLLAERYLVDAVKPGSRVTVIGIHSTFTSRASGRGQGTNDAGVRVPFLRVLGITQDSEASDVLLGKVTPEDEDELRQIAEQPDVYDQIVASIAPDIKTHDDIKKAIACSLFGGSRKVLPDGMRLRGDINILLLGDPGVAKSQFLRFAHEAAPISVYTSGKGSSAAGLTASVVRDPATGDFQLEGGAMVLADGGIVCIDEFDKMREQDRVAIHEAMEQQTISVAKAGITTILNSRTSVIAAANPQFGRYDDFKSAAENIHFQASILSRFDLIFIIRDIQDSALDAALADHIVRVHKRQAKTAPEERDGLIPVNKIKKLIAFARRKSPRLSDSAADLLADKYVEFRQTVNQQRASQDGAGAADVIPVTVRQLEALARISEALARMELSDVATEDHVREALRLFKVATMQATSSPDGAAVPGMAGFGEQMKRCEEVFSALVPIGQVQNTRDVVRALIAQHGFDERVVTMCLDALVQRGEFHYQNRKRQIQHTQRT